MCGRFHGPTMRWAREHQLSTPSGTILDPMLRAEPVGPRITYYDDAAAAGGATGERIELSPVTDRRDRQTLARRAGRRPGQPVAILLPAHWQTAAVLFGVWWIGAEVVRDGAAELALCTADRLDDADSAVAGGEVAVLSLDPFGRPAPDLPFSVTDYATAVPVHGARSPDHRRAASPLPRWPAARSTGS